MQTVTTDFAITKDGGSRLSEGALEARARRAARRAGYVATKSRWRAGSVDNLGEFMIVNPSTNGIVAGQRFDMNAHEVIAWCKDE